MKKLILVNWLILAVAALLVGLYITLFENLFRDKGYLYFIIALIFGAVYFFEKRKA